MSVVASSFCGRCGEDLQTPHPACEAALALEPPRYCTHCHRRMVVQVVPTGWRATCSVHGAVVGG
jgi:hypothetical protein